MIGLHHYKIIAHLEKERDLFSQSFVFKQNSIVVLELQQQILIFNLHILFCSQTMTDVETTFRKLNYTIIAVVGVLAILEGSIPGTHPMALPPTHKIAINNKMNEFLEAVTVRMVGDESPGRRCVACVVCSSVTIMVCQCQCGGGGFVVRGQAQHSTGCRAPLMAPHLGSV